MTSNTIGERFDEQFPEWKQKNAQALHVKAFILAELERIALECDNAAPHKSGTFFLEGMREGLQRGASIIRSAGESLK